jgi:signal transduction histidine kinase
MNRSSDRLYHWIYWIVFGLYFAAVLLRSILIFQDEPFLFSILGRLALFALLFVSEQALERRVPHYAKFYVIIQTGLVFSLLAPTDEADFFAALLGTLSMQVMLHLDYRWGFLWIFLCALGLAWIFFQAYDPSSAIALAVLFTAGSVFLGTYSLATRRAQAARQLNHSLAAELQAANQQLQAFSIQQEQLAIARERNRLARDLHDSVTQTVFSMTLVTQAASISLEHDPKKVADHLDRLSQLSHSALSEIQVLVAQLKPESSATDELVTKLRRHIGSSRFPPELSISLSVEGSQSLAAHEEQSLFHIAEEALNNIVKHSLASQAQIVLHLCEPFWMEIVDQGQGFDLTHSRGSGRVGLAGMRERAVEMGWKFTIESSPGTGTRIRVEKHL